MQAFIDQEIEYKSLKIMLQVHKTLAKLHFEYMFNFGHPAIQMINWKGEMEKI